MRRLHLKLFYLRTRVRREPQGVTARMLNVRPATMSHLEQGRSLPTLPMLLALCKHYDVTPSYLLNDDRPIEPGSRDRWSERNALLCRGDWIEASAQVVQHTQDGYVLCPVTDGTRFYDDLGMRQRLQCARERDSDLLEQSLSTADREQDLALEHQLMRELHGQRKPRSKVGAMMTGSSRLGPAPAPDS